MLQADLETIDEILAALKRVLCAEVEGWQIDAPRTMDTAVPTEAPRPKEPPGPKGTSPLHARGTPRPGCTTASWYNRASDISHSTRKGIAPVAVDKSVLSLALPLVSPLMLPAMKRTPHRGAVTTAAEPQEVPMAQLGGLCGENKSPLLFSVNEQRTPWRGRKLLPPPSPIGSPVPLLEKRAGTLPLLLDPPLKTITRSLLSSLARLSSTMGMRPFGPLCSPGQMHAMLPVCTPPHHQSTSHGFESK